MRGWDEAMRKQLSMQVLVPDGASTRAVAMRLLRAMKTHVHKKKLKLSKPEAVPPGCVGRLIGRYRELSCYNVGLFDEPGMIYRVDVWVG